MEWVVIWLIGAIIVAIIAANKGRSAFGWFLFGFLLWPVALVAILVSSNLDDEDEALRQAEIRWPCPYCAELIMKAARICPHCRSELSEDWGDENVPIPAKPDKTKDLYKVAKEAIAAADALGLREQDTSEYAARALRKAHGGLTNSQAIEIAEKCRTDVIAISAVPDENMPIPTKPERAKDLSTIAKEVLAAAALEPVPVLKIVGVLAAIIHDGVRV